MEPFDFVMVGLLKTEAIDQFYEQSAIFLHEILQHSQSNLNPQILQESLILNKALFLAQMSDLTFELPFSYNLWEFYQGVLKGQEVELKEVSSIYVKDWVGKPDFQIKQQVKT